MEGIGPPLATPFTDEGHLDVETLCDLVGWVESRGVDFLVPCGSNSEAELMTADERTTVVERVVDAASVPVLAGTGHPGLVETLAATEAAADAGADAALVVTPFYYRHDQATLASYYRDLADASPLPVYLYSVPAYTGVRLDPETVGELATHPNVAGMKDSSGDIETLLRLRRATREADFELFVGSGSVLAGALDVGVDGGVLALANVVPESAAAVYRRHRAGDAGGARALNADLVELNRAITAIHGVPGLKAAMSARDAPGGHPRRPHRAISASVRRELARLVDEAPTPAPPDGR